ncbi:MAG: Fe-S cluster assembly protein IscX [Gammaproteobacteria bacterium]
MPLNWTDTIDIAIDLELALADVDPKYVNFVDLMNWVMELPEFEGEREHCGEKILEAIQMAWIEERE